MADVQQDPNLPEIGDADRRERPGDEQKDAA